MDCLRGSRDEDIVLKEEQYELLAVAAQKNHCSLFVVLPTNFSKPCAQLYLITFASLVIKIVRIFYPKEWVRLISKQPIKVWFSFAFSKNPNPEHHNFYRKDRGLWLLDFYFRKKRPHLKLWSKTFNTRIPRHITFFYSVTSYAMINEHWSQY